MAAIFKIENRPYLRNVSTDHREIWHNDAYWASEVDRQLNFQFLKIQDGGLNARGVAKYRDFGTFGGHITHSQESFVRTTIEQYLLMRRPVCVKSVIHRVGVELYATLSTLPISPNKTAKILNTEDSFYIYDTPLTEINVIASFCVLNLRII